MQNNITKFQFKGSPIIYTSSRYLTQPSPKNIDECVKLLQNCNINTILNVSADHKANKKHLELYKKLNINYYEICINDYMYPPTETYYDDFLEKCINWYNSLQNKNINILIHCSAGINRSNTVAATILWSISKINPQILFDKMQDLHIKSRSIKFIYNESLKNAFFRYCEYNINNKKRKLSF